VSVQEALARTADLRAGGRGEEKLLELTLAAFRQVVAGKRDELLIGPAEARVVLRALAASMRKAELAADRAAGPAEDLEQARLELEAWIARGQDLVRRLR
jgi:nitrogenase molybdenum-iron protein alpha/beta subunit